VTWANVYQPNSRLETKPCLEEHPYPGPNDDFRRDGSVFYDSHKAAARALFEIWCVSGTDHAQQVLPVGDGGRRQSIGSLVAPAKQSALAWNGHPFTCARVCPRLNALSGAALVNHPRRLVSFRYRIVPTIPGDRDMLRTGLPWSRNVFNCSVREEDVEFPTSSGASSGIKITEKLLCAALSGRISSGWQPKAGKHLV